MMRRWTPFAYGFRPFFLLAGVYAAVGMSAWLWTYPTGLSLFRSLPPQLWHSHEMLFGFIAAAVAGFVLTAVPSWTGSRGFAGAPLITLVILWFAGRIAFAFFNTLPLIVVISAEILFLPAVMVTIAPSLFRTRNRNMVLLLVIAAFWSADLVFLYAVHAGDVVTASAALRAGIDVILLLMTMIAGRVVPPFTANALRKRGMDVSFHSRKTIERGVFVAMIAYIAAQYCDVQLFHFWKRLTQGRHLCLRNNRCGDATSEGLAPQVQGFAVGLMCEPQGFDAIAHQRGFVGFSIPDCLASAFRSSRLVVCAVSTN